MSAIKNLDKLKQQYPDDQRIIAMAEALKLAVACIQKEYNRCGYWHEGYNALTAIREKLEGKG